jgi:hypothetical protein
MAADSTVTIGVAFLLNLLVMAYSIGRSQQKNAGELDKMKTQVNGVGKKTGKIVLYLSETAEGEKRERLTDILKDT